MHLKYQNEDYMTLSRMKMKLNMKPSKVKSSKVQHLIMEWNMMKVLPEGSHQKVNGSIWLNTGKSRGLRLSAEDLL